MRTKLQAGSALAAVITIVIIGGCASPTTYTKRAKTENARETAAIEALECRKAAVVARRGARARVGYSTTPEARAKVAAAMTAAWERCLHARGWQKKG
jgi:hypothetical protein